MVTVISCLQWRVYLHNQHIIQPFEERGKMEITYGFSFKNICLYSCMCLPYWIKMCLFLPSSHKNILALLASIWRGMKELVHEVWRNRKFLPKVVLLSFWPPGPCSDTKETSLVYYLKLHTPILRKKAKKKTKESTSLQTGNYCDHDSMFH